MDTREELADHLQKMEELLHLQSVRSSKHELDKLLADEFFEFGNSGNIWTKEAVIRALKSESFSRRSISGFKLTVLAPEVVLVTYHVHRVETRERPSADSLRSSIWKRIGAGWKMVFHQGTLCQELHGM